MKYISYFLLFCIASVFVATYKKKGTAIEQRPAIQKKGLKNLDSDGKLPGPDHIVLVIMENHSYEQIIGNPQAAYINALAVSSNTALFTQSFSVEHPSQPNYLDLYSGSNQGVVDDDFPAAIPFNTPNLGRQLTNAGKTFITYSEDFPAAGFSGSKAGKYVHKHNAAANWIGDGPNQVSASVSQPFSAFPTDYAKLPTVSFVIPSTGNDMHSGSIAAGDACLKSKLGGYIEWAKTHNSIFMLTFDEDNYKKDNHITTIFSGQRVKAVQEVTKINHYSLLRTMEAMYGLGYAGNAATVSTISSCWK